MMIHLNRIWNVRNRIATAAVCFSVAPFSLHAVAQPPSALPNSSALAELHLAVQVGAPAPQEQTWSGEITTAMCKTAVGSMGHDCVMNCVKAGEKLVLITKGHVNEISNQDFSDLTAHAGHHVKLTGHLGPDGKTITVTQIEMVPHGNSSHPATNK